MLRLQKMSNPIIHIEQCGYLTTLQDGGRKGYLNYGVSKGGAMDMYAMNIANLLTGNEQNEAVLEITQSPHRLRFLTDALIAFTGGGLQPVIQQTELPLYQPHFVRADTVIDLQQQLSGFRLYLSVAGGFETDSFLNSCATDLTVQAGGFSGRKLKKGDLLNAIRKLNVQQKEWMQVLKSSNIRINHQLTANHTDVLRVFKNAEWEYLTNEAKQKITASPFTVTIQSNRMGYRLTGDALHTVPSCNIISSPVTQGTVQLTSSGELIVLMADAQTIGGYPRVLQIAGADLHILAQKKPGDRIQFKLIEFEEAEELLLTQKKQLHSLQQLIQKFYAH